MILDCTCTPRQPGLQSGDRSFSGDIYEEMKQIFPIFLKISDSQKIYMKIYCIQCDKYNCEAGTEERRNDASDENIFISNH